MVIWLGKEDGLDPDIRSKYEDKPTWNYVVKMGTPSFRKALIVNKYWTRAWVVQEFLLQYT